MRQERTVQASLFDLVLSRRLTTLLFLRGSGRPESRLRTSARKAPLIPGRSLIRLFSPSRLDQPSQPPDGLKWSCKPLLQDQRNPDSSNKNICLWTGTS